MNIYFGHLAGETYRNSRMVPILVDHTIVQVPLDRVSIRVQRG